MARGVSEQVTLSPCLVVFYWYFCAKCGGPGGPRERIFGALGRAGSRRVGSEYVAAPLTPEDGTRRVPNGFVFCIVLFDAIFDRFCVPTWHPKSNKIAQKSMPRCTPSWTPFVDRFLLDVCSQLGPPDPEKSSPRCSQSTILEKSPFQVNIDF